MRVEKVEEEEEEEEEAEGEERGREGGREGMNRADTEQREREAERGLHVWATNVSGPTESSQSVSPRENKIYSDWREGALASQRSTRGVRWNCGPRPLLHSFPQPHLSSLSLSLSTHPPSLPAPVLFKYTRVYMYIYIWLNHYNKIACPLLTVSHPLIS